MALIELNLEKPALKRTETGESSSKQSKRSTSGETKATEKSGEGSSQVVEMPEGESVEEKSSGGGGMFRRVAMLAATAGAVMAVRRLRSRRKGGTEQTEFEEEWETPRSE